MAMPKIKIGRYETTGGTVSAPPVGKRWAGWIEPEDKSWIIFIRQDGGAVFYDTREPGGAVVEKPRRTWEQIVEKVDGARRSMSPHQYEAWLSSEVGDANGRTDYDYTAGDPMDTIRWISEVETWALPFTPEQLGRLVRAPVYSHTTVEVFGIGPGLPDLVMAIGPHDSAAYYRDDLDTMQVRFGVMSREGFEALPEHGGW